LTIFDEQKICDPATFASPRQPAIGIRHVLVNGVPIVRDGATIEKFEKPPGRWLKFRR